MATRTVHARVAVGDTFGRWEVTAPAGPKIYAGRPFRQWLCRCSCRGAERPIREDSLLNGSTLSCGCHRKEVSSRVTVPGAHVNGRQAPEYVAYHHMLKRCYKPRTAHYADYGGRGITVCDRWRFGEDGKSGFECFLADMGPRPTPKLSIGRLDNDGMYRPENCRWMTQAEQLRNTRRNRFLTHDGKTMTIMDWAAEVGLNWSALYKRIDAGWSVERALTTPAGRGRKGS